MVVENKEKVFFLKGMHCASCELVIEKKILETFSSMKLVDASLRKGQVIMEYEGIAPTVSELNNLFDKEQYVFSETPFKEHADYLKQSVIWIMVFFSLIALYGLMKRFDVINLFSVDANSSMGAFFLLGIIAGISSCAALVGSIVLSLSKQWSDLYHHKDSFTQRLEPHILFNSGRLLSYTLLGGILGWIGSFFAFDISIYAWIVIIISLFILLLGLQMMGVQSLQKFQFTLPKVIIRKFANQTNLKRRYVPFVLGIGTFFLPCGFTMTVQSIALISGSSLTGALIMGAFALGTMPSLCIIGFSSVKCLQKPHYANIFLNIAGFLVILFAFYTINSQLNVLGYMSLTNLVIKNKEAAVTLQEGDNQIIRMDATAFGYEPSYFKIKKGVPVVWEIMNRGASGCTDKIIAPAIFSDQIELQKNSLTKKEFILNKEGVYKFSCWMGMTGGVIEVIN